MYNLERPLRYSHVLTKHCPCHLLPERASPKHEYRGPTLRPPCYVIEHHNPHRSPWKILFLAQCWRVFSFLWSKWSCVSYFRIFKMAAMLRSRQTFFIVSNTGSWIYQQKKPCAFSIFWAFDRRCSWNIDGDIAISKFDLLCDLPTSSMMSWIRIYSNVVIILCYLCTGSLMMIYLFVF